MKRASVLVLLFGVSLFLIYGGESFATAIMLDFSSGTYSVQNPTNQYINKYTEDGFIVRTASSLDAFSKIFGEHGPVLAWYNGDTVVVVEYAGGNFSLESVDLPVTAFAGLTFTSSKQTVLNVAGDGNKQFSGSGWTDISYFTIKKQNNFDILTELDNVMVALTPVSAVTEPATMLLIASGLAGIAGLRRKLSQM